MNDLLDKIVFYLKKYNRPVVKLLQQGISRDSIEKQIESINLEFPEDYFKLYELYNGTLVNEDDLLDDLHFYPGYYFLSIEDAIEYYKILIDSGWWNKNWFPIFACGGRDFICLDCTVGNGYPIIGYITGYDDEEDLRDHLNLYSMFKTIAECFEKGAYYLDEKNGYLEADMEKERIIGRENNPGLERWV